MTRFRQGLAADVPVPGCLSHSATIANDRQHGFVSLLCRAQIPNARACLVSTGTLLSGINRISTRDLLRDRDSNLNLAVNRSRRPFLGRRGIVVGFSCADALGWLRRSVGCPEGKPIDLFFRVARLGVLRYEDAEENHPGVDLERISPTLVDRQEVTRCLTSIELGGAAHWSELSVL